MKDMTLCCPTQFNQTCTRACGRRVRLPVRGQALFSEDPRKGRNCSMFIERAGVYDHKNIKANPASYVIKAKGEYYVWYNTDKDDKALLLDTEGKKTKATVPAGTKMDVVKVLPHKAFNGSLYFRTRIGVFSAVTGIKVKHPKILALFGEGKKEDK